MREVPAVRQVHRQNLITRLDARKVNGGVGLAARVRLDVSVVSTEESLRTVNRQLLDFVDLFATTIPALTRVAFGILIRQHAALRFHNCRQGEVLRGNQFEVRLLTVELGLDEGVDFWVELGERSAADGSHENREIGERCGSKRDNGKGGQLSTSLYLGDATVMAPTLELGRQEGFGTGQSQRQVDIFSPQTQDVRVIMPTAQLGGVGALHQGGPDAGDLVGSNRNADAGRADEEPEPGTARGHIRANGVGVVGIVTGGLGLGTAVEDGVAFGTQGSQEVPAQGQASMVAAKGKGQRGGHGRIKWCFSKASKAGMASTIESRHSS